MFWKTIKTAIATGLTLLTVLCCAACQESPKVEYVPRESTVKTVPAEPAYSEADFVAAKNLVSAAINRLDNNYGGVAFTTSLLGTGVDTIETRDQLQWNVDGDKVWVELESDHSDYIAVTSEGNRARAWCGEHKVYESFDVENIPQIVHTQQLLLQLVDCARKLDQDVMADSSSGFYCFILDDIKLRSVMDVSSFYRLDYACLVVSVDGRGRPEYVAIELYGPSRESPAIPLQAMTEINFYDIGFTKVDSLDE